MFINVIRKLIFSNAMVKCTYLVCNGFQPNPWSNLTRMIKASNLLCFVYCLILFMNYIKVSVLVIFDVCPGCQYTRFYPILFLLNMIKAANNYELILCIANHLFNQK